MNALSVVAGSLSSVTVWRSEKVIRAPFFVRKISARLGSIPAMTWRRPRGAAALAIVWSMQLSPAEFLRQQINAPYATGLVAARLFLVFLPRQKAAKAALRGARERLR